MPYRSAIPSPGGYRDVSPAAVNVAGHGVRIVDVRERHELAGELGHIPGVEHVPLALFVASAAGWARNEPIVLVCRSGARSSQAARWLVSAGFEQVMSLAGGMLAYRAAGLPVEH